MCVLCPSTRSNTSTTTKQCVAVCCDVLQCVTVCCSMVQLALCAFLASLQSQIHSFFISLHQLRIVLHRIAVCCSMLQYVVVCCSALQCVAACCSILQCALCASSTLLHIQIHQHRPNSKYCRPLLQEGPCMSAKEICISAKEIHIFAKKMHISAKEIHISAEEIYISAKEIYISAKETCNGAVMTHDRQEEQEQVT